MVVKTFLFGHAYIDLTLAGFRALFDLIPSDRRCSCLCFVDLPYPKSGATFGETLSCGAGAAAYGGMPSYVETREYVRQNLANLAIIRENTVNKAGQAPINADNSIQSCQTDTYVR
ncbi:MAG TPA: hypothetical protein VN042_01950 [Asticcacaulis sp.]|nr:hypothetical protein [Asticcacaulis sp.]